MSMEKHAACDKERIESLYRTLPQNLVATFVTAALLAYCLYEMAILSAALYWLVGMAVVNILRLPLLRVCRQLRNDKITVTRAAYTFNTGAFFAGLGWGFAFLVVPNELGLATAYVAIFVACVMAISCIAYQASFYTVLAFNLPIISIAVGKFYQADTTHILALSAVIYAALLLISAWRTAQRIDWEIGLRHKHSELVAALADEKRKTEELNQVLENKVEARTKSLHEVNQALKAEITEKECAQQELARINTQFGALYDEHPSILLTLNGKGLLINVNKYGARYLGYPHAALLRMKFDELCTQGEKATSLLQQIIHEDTLETRGRLEIVKSSGEVIAVQATFRRVDDDLTETQIIVVCEDVTEIDRLHQQLAYHASRDTLTGLYNRREFEIRIKQLFERTKRHSDTHVVCIIDLDRFKLINDTSGHLAGDKTLKSITSAMTHCMRQTDVLARLGGDEFGIIMEKTSIDDAEIIIERLRDAIQSIEVVWEGTRHQVSASFGLTTLDADSVSVTNVMRDADAACYLAKESGRNCVRTIDVSNRAQARGIRKSPNWSTKLRAAVAEENLFLALQPVINQHTRATTQQEAFIRIRDEDGNYSDAHLFIAAAEKLGLIGVLDQWMFDSAIELLYNDLRFSNESCISLNLSRFSLCDENFRIHAIELLKNHSDIAHQICLEINESALRNIEPETASMLNEFRSLGGKLTIDDFSGSLVGLQQLDQIKADMVKLDPVLIEHLNKSQANKDLLATAISLAHRFGFRAIAKGVVNTTQVSELLELGVSDMQGYAVQRPVNVLSQSVANLKQSA